MEKLRSSRPAVDILRELRFTVGSVGRELESIFELTHPTGEVRTAKIQKSGVPSGSYGRHRYGIAYEAFLHVDEIVFYAEGERFILIVPTDDLDRILKEKPDKAKIEGSQWIVNIYFDRAGQQLHPVGYGKDYDIGDCASPIPT